LATEPGRRNLARVVCHQPDVAIDFAVPGHAGDHLLNALDVPVHHQLTDPFDNRLGVEANERPRRVQRVVGADQVADVPGQGNGAGHDQRHDGSQFPDEFALHPHA